MFLSKVGTSDASEQPSLTLSIDDEALSTSDEHAVDGVLVPRNDGSSRVMGNIGFWKLANLTKRAVYREQEAKDGVDQQSVTTSTVPGRGERKAALDLIRR